MATASSAAQIASLFAEYQELTSAIALLNAGGSGYGLVLITADGSQETTVRVPNMPTANLITFLTNRQTTVANQITGAGYTLS